MSHDGRAMVWTGSTWVPMLVDSTGRPILDQALGGGGVPSWRPAHTPGLALSPVADFGRLQTDNVGLALDIGRQSNRIAQTPGFATSLLGATGTPVQPAHTPGFAMSARISDFKMPETPAFEMVQVVYGLNRLVGGNAQAAVGTAWTNPANAISGTNGLHDAVNATCAGSAGGNTNGIELSYLNHTLKGELAIASATLNVYAAGVDATGLLLSTVISYNIGAGLVTLETIAGAFSSLTTPRSYVLPITTWTEYNALQARVVCTFAALSALANASLDAIEIQIVASRTDAL